MSPTLQLLLALGIIILSAKSAGYLSTRLGQPAVLGELLAGLVLGPTVLNLMHLPMFAGGHADEIISELGELGVIFLMFTAGLEVDLDGMFAAGKAALLVGVLGVVVPIALAIPVGLAFNFPPATSIFIGIILAATSVSISAQTLLELGVLRSKEGLALLGAAVVDDVLVILVLSVFLALADGAAGGATDLVIVLARMIVFFGAAILLGAKVLPRVMSWIESLPVSEGVMAFVVIVTMGYAWSAEVVGAIAAITGAFLAGIFFARTSLKHAIERGMHTLTYTFFVPIFLIGIGLKANARVLELSELFFVTAIILVAITGKVIGGWLGARLGGFDARGALRIGVGMVSRGEVGLIVAALGLANGLISQNTYSGMIVMVLVTTLVTPLLLRQVFPKMEMAHG